MNPVLFLFSLIVTSDPSVASSHPENWNPLTECEDTFSNELKEQALKINVLLNQIKEGSKHTTRMQLEQETPKTLKFFTKILLSKEEPGWEKAKHNFLYALEEIKPKEPEISHILADIFSSEKPTNRLKQAIAHTLGKITKPEDIKVPHTLIQVFSDKKTPLSLEQAVAEALGEIKPKDPEVCRILSDIIASKRGNNQAIKQLLIATLEKIIEAHPEISHNSADILVFRKTVSSDIEEEQDKTQRELDELEALQNGYENQIVRLKPATADRHYSKHRIQWPDKNQIPETEFQRVDNMEMVLNEIQESLKAVRKKIANLKRQVQQFKDEIFQSED